MIGMPCRRSSLTAGLATTTQGQILLLDGQMGDFAAPEVRLRPNADPAEPRYGLGDCITGGPQCGVPVPPAVDDQNKRFYLNFTPDGADQSELRAFGYGEHDGETHIIEQWAVKVGGGIVGTPVLSADHHTVYVFGRDGRLHALAAQDGKERWNHDLGGFGFGTMAVSPDGVIIPTGALGEPLRILKDAGDKAEVVAERKDVQTAGLATITGGDSAWVVTRTGADQKLQLTEVALSDGSTNRTLELPGATGFATGVAVSGYGSVAVAANLGEVFYFN